MKRFAGIAVAVAALCLAVPSASAQCPPPDPNDNEACIEIGAGATAADIAEALGQNWHLPDYACSSTGGSVTVTLEAGQSEEGERTMTFEVEADGNVDDPHTMNFIFDTPTGVSNGPFDISADFDGNGPVLLRDGTTQFADIAVMVVTAPSSPNQALPMLSGRRTVLFTIGLLVAGAAVLAFRRMG